MSIRIATLAACALVAGTVLTMPAAHAASVEVWTGMGDGTSWTDAANWSTHQAPQAGDSVVIAPPSLEQCHAHVVDAPQIALADLSLAENALNGSVCEASLSGTGITVSGTFTLHGGVLDTPTTLLPGSSGAITPAVDDRSELTEDLTVDSTLTLTDNTYAGGNDPDRSLELQAGTSLVVAPGGTLDTAGTNVVDATSCCLSPGRIVNGGTVDDTGSLTLDDVELDQDGVLDVEQAGDEVVSLGAPNTAGNGAHYLGAGSYRVTEGSARDTLSGTQTLGPDFHFVLGGNAATSSTDADGDESLHGSATFAGTGELDWQGGVLAGDLTIAHGARLVADGNVVGGNDDHRELTDLDVPDDGGAIHPAKLTDHGTATFTDGAGVHFTGDSRLVDAVDGTLSLAPGTNLSGDCCSTQGSVVNQGGTVAVPAGPGTAPVTFDGVGYAATGGSTTIATGRTLVLGGGATSALASTTLSGGTVQLADPVQLSRTISVVRTAVQLRHGASLADVRTVGKNPEAATLTGSGSLAWSAGELGGLLTVHLARVTISGTAAKDVAAAAGGTDGHVVIAAPLDVAAGTDDEAGADVVQIDGGSTLQTAGVTTLHRDVHLSGGHVLNTGSVTVAAGRGGRAYVTGGASFDNRGTVTVSSGTLALDGDYAQHSGRTTVAAGAVLRETSSSAVVRIGGGTLAGAGTVSGSTVIGTAVLSPTGYGTLTMHGNLSTRSGSVLDIDVAHGRRGLISVSGSVALTGRLALHDLGTPAAADHPVPVVAGGRLTSSRTCVTTTGAGTTGGGAHHWAASVSGHHLVLSWVAGRRTTC